MREGVAVLVLVVLLGLVALGCSGEERDSARKGAERKAGENTAPLIGSDLGHQAFQSSTRLVVPAGVGEPADLAARVLAGLSESPLGVRLFVDERPGEGGSVAWRDVAGEEPEGHQLAYVTEGLLAAGGTGGVGPEDFEMVAQTDRGFAVLVAEGDPEIETLQWEDVEDFGDFLRAAKKDPEDVEVADPGAETVYRAGTLALEREAGVDLSLKTPANKAPVLAVYDGDVESALVPLDPVVLADVRAGELKALAVVGGERCPDLPRVPTTEELGYDVGVPVFGGIAAPSGTPQDVVDELGRAFVASASSRAFGRALVGTARVPEQKGPRRFAAFVDERAGNLSGATRKKERGG